MAQSDNVIRAIFSLNECEKINLKQWTAFFMAPSVLSYATGMRAEKMIPFFPISGIRNTPPAIVLELFEAPRWLGTPSESFLR